MKRNVLILALAGAFLVSGSAFAEVKIKGKNDQSTNVTGAVANSAVGLNSKATQNVSSNKGKVTLGGDNKQQTNIKGAVVNSAVGLNSKAEQNVSSNSGD